MVEDKENKGIGNVILEGLIVFGVIFLIGWGIEYTTVTLYDEYFPTEEVVKETKPEKYSDIVTADFAEAEMQCRTSDGIMVKVRFNVLRGYSISTAQSHYYGIIRVLPIETVTQKIMQINYKGAQTIQVIYEERYTQLLHAQEKRKAQEQLQLQKILEAEALVARAAAIRDVEIEIAKAKERERLVIEAVNNRNK